MCYKLLCLCLVVFLNQVQGWGRGDLEKYGLVHTALGTISCEHDRSLDLDISAVDVYFYDFSTNYSQLFTIGNAAQGILAIPNLDKNKKIKLFVTGYKSSINKKTALTVREKLKALPDMYLIMPDHSFYTNDQIGFVKSYERSVKYVHYVGKALGQLLIDLNKGGIPAKNIHAIGHSLGAQMIAHSGETFFNSTGEKIWRVTGLDPAGPCFSNSFVNEQIRSGVAEYVEVYHCNAGTLGTTTVLADIDFFINHKGEAQPNCSTPLIPKIWDSLSAAKCSHKTCMTLWTASIAHPDWFPAWQCDTYRSFRNGRCSGNNSTIAGYWNPGNATGVYYFNTYSYDIN